MDARKLNQYFNIFPVQGNGDKAPAIVDNIQRRRIKWKEVREKKMTDEYLAGFKEFGVVCGVDGLEVIDIDNHFDDADKLLEYISDNYDISRFLVIKTQGGGFHIYLKSDHCAGNQKLANRINQKGKKEALVETRGDGGYVCFYDDIINGTIESVPRLTKDERAELIEVCKSLDEVGGNKIEIPEEKPGEKYNSEGMEDVRSLLRAHGWNSTDGIHWQRPGKKNGISATLGKVGNDKRKFYVFSTNADPFESETSYSLFGVYATLEHGGDYKQATRALAEKYDIKPVTKPKSKQKQQQQTDTTKTGKWGVLEEIIKDWGLKFRFNTLVKTMEYSVGGKPWQEEVDILLGDIILEMETNRGVNSISKNKLQEMILNRTICDVYNPIDEFISSIPEWDQRKRFADFEKYIQIPDTEDIHYFVTMLKKHMIRTLKCATTDYVNRFVLAFHGPQEIGKTLFFKWLVPGNVYNDETIDPGEKDSVLALGRYLMINMDELDSLNKREVAKLKAFISKGDITKRVAYGRYDQRFKRVASLYGSTNKSDILADEHNTRWMILKVRGFDWKGYKSAIDPMQLWAECWHELQQDEDAGELTPKEKVIRDTRNNSEFLETRPEGELVRCYFEACDSQSMTTTEIMEVLQLNYPDMKNQLNFTQLGRELRREFGQPVGKRRNGRYGKYYSIKPVAGMQLPNGYLKNLGNEEFPM